MKRISDKRRRQLALENIEWEAVRVRANGRCERCHEKPDFRGLSRSHIKTKGMGGSSHNFTRDEMQALCYPCHNPFHGVREVKADPMWSQTEKPPVKGASGK